jgi:hypothetical protein
LRHCQSDSVVREGKRPTERWLHRPAAKLALCIGRDANGAIGPRLAVAPIHPRRSTVLVIKLIGVAIGVALAVRWRGMRLPLLLLLLLLALLHIWRSHELAIEPRELLGPTPTSAIRSAVPAVPADAGTDMTRDGGPITDECPGVPTCGPGN